MGVFTRVILSIALIPTSHINCRLPRPLRAHTTHFLTNKHHLRPPSTQHSSLPILSSTHPLIPETEHSTMDSPRGSHLDNGKSPTPPVGFRPQNGGIIKVQPPRREDLQPSYAQTLQGDEEGAVQACVARQCGPGHQVWSLLPRRRSWLGQDQPSV